MGSTFHRNCKPSVVTVGVGDTATVTLVGFVGTPTTSWSVSGKASVTITGNTATITGVAEGSTVLTFTDTDTDTATVSITVVE